MDSVNTNIYGPFNQNGVGTADASGLGIDSGQPDFQLAGDIPWWEWARNAVVGTGELIGALLVGTASFGSYLVNKGAETVTTTWADMERAFASEEFRTPEAQNAFASLVQEQIPGAQAFFRQDGTLEEIRVDGRQIFGRDAQGNFGVSEDIQREINRALPSIPAPTTPAPPTVNFDNPIGDPSYTGNPNGTIWDPGAETAPPVTETPVVEAPVVETPAPADGQIAPVVVATQGEAQRRAFDYNRANPDKVALVAVGADGQFRVYEGIPAEAASAFFERFVPSTPSLVTALPLEYVGLSAEGINRRIVGDPVPTTPQQDVTSLPSDPITVDFTNPIDGGFELNPLGDIWDPSQPLFNVGGQGGLNPGQNPGNNLPPGTVLGPRGQPIPGTGQPPVGTGSGQTGMGNTQAGQGNTQAGQGSQAASGTGGPPPDPEEEERRRREEFDSQLKDDVTKALQNQGFKGQNLADKVEFFRNAFAKQYLNTTQIVSQAGSATPPAATSNWGTPFQWGAGLIGLGGAAVTLAPEFVAELYNRVQGWLPGGGEQQPDATTAPPTQDPTGVQTTELPGGVDIPLAIPLPTLDQLLTAMNPDGTTRQLDLLYADDYQQALANGVDLIKTYENEILNVGNEALERTRGIADAQSVQIALDQIQNLANGGSKMGASMIITLHPTVQEVVTNVQNSLTQLRLLEGRIPEMLADEREVRQAQVSEDMYEYTRPSDDLLQEQAAETTDLFANQPELDPNAPDFDSYIGNLDGQREVLTDQLDELNQEQARLNRILDDFGPNAPPEQRDPLIAALNDITAAIGEKQTQISNIDNQKLNATTSQRSNELSEQSAQLSQDSFDVSQFNDLVADGERSIDAYNNNYASGGTLSFEGLERLRLPFGGNGYFNIDAAAQAKAGAGLEQVSHLSLFDHFVSTQEDLNWLRAVLGPDARTMSDEQLQSELENIRNQIAQSDAMAGRTVTFTPDEVGRILRGDIPQTFEKDATPKFGEDLQSDLSIVDPGSTFLANAGAGDLDGVLAPGEEVPVDQLVIDDNTTFGTIDVPSDWLNVPDPALPGSTLPPDIAQRLSNPGLTKAEFESPTYDVFKHYQKLGVADPQAVTETLLGVEINDLVDPFERTLRDIQSNPFVSGFLDGLGDGPARQFFEGMFDNADFTNALKDFANGEPGSGFDVGNHIYRLLEDNLPDGLSDVASFARDAFNLNVAEQRGQLTGASLLDASLSALAEQLGGEAGKIVNTMNAVSQYLIKPTPDAFVVAASAVLDALGASDEAQFALGSLATAFATTKAAATAGLSLAVGSLMKIIGLDDVINNFYMDVFKPIPDEFAIGKVDLPGGRKEVMFNRHEETLKIDGQPVSSDFVPDLDNFAIAHDVPELVLYSVDTGKIIDGYDREKRESTFDVERNFSDMLVITSGYIPDDILKSEIVKNGPQGLIPYIYLPKEDKRLMEIVGSDALLTGLASSRIDPAQTTDEEFAEGDLDGWVDDVAAVFLSGQVKTPFGENPPIFANPTTPGGEPVEMPVGGWPWEAVVTGPALAEVRNFLLQPTMLGDLLDPRIPPKSDDQLLWEFINTDRTAFYAVETFSAPEESGGTPFAALFKMHPEAGVTMEIQSIPPAVPVPGFPGVTQNAPGTGLEQVVAPIQFPNEAVAREFAPLIPTIMNWIASDPARFDLLSKPQGLLEAHAQMLTLADTVDPVTGESALSIGFDPQAYLEANPDVAAMYNGNTFRAVEHYVNFGQAEGRPIGTGTMTSRDGAFEVDTKTFGPSEPGGDVRVEATVVSVAPDGSRTVVQEATIANQLELDTLLLQAGVIDPATIDPEANPLTAALAEVVELAPARLTEGDDVYLMSDARDAVFGLGGNDAITGTDAVNTIYGNQGDDNLVGMGGADAILGGQGNDVVYGNSGFDRLFGDDGNDTIFGGIGYDELLGNLGDDVLHGDAGNDSVHGGQGADQVHGGDGFDQVFGDLGNDVVTGGAGDDDVFGGQGDDNVHGGQGNDMVYGGQGNDMLFGDAGDDVLSGDKGDDVIDGGEGFDAARFSGDLSQYDITIEGDQIRVTHKNGGADGSDLVSGVESFQFGNATISVENLRAYAMNASAPTSDTLDGDAGANTVSAGQGDDVVRAGQGDDVVNGGQGMDTLFGGQGNDMLNGDLGDDTLVGDRGDDVIDGGEGIDIAQFGLDIAQYRILIEGDAIRVTQRDDDGTGDGSDLVSNVEAFNFAGTMYSADDLRAMAENA
ncbi:hypothetical protein [Salinarimonas ramus]|uniref:Ca2+-binding protein, RTX toxin-related n=1 Tax=Salinarimonas ramus TaxID=690164 RepID=A0A917V259_9HYPH|nr:hypothetical protein [Salinarimonas ramus]GGK19198.1 hypothetical protein GCM10011322_02290 [Salinarimonas ramus]